jgi:hypothetical protein
LIQNIDATGTISVQVMEGADFDTATSSYTLAPNEQCNVYVDLSKRVLIEEYPYTAAEA